MVVYFFLCRESQKKYKFYLSLRFSCGGNGNPLQYSCLENPRDRGAWWAAVYGVAQSRTRLKRLSSSSSSSKVFTKNGKECNWCVICSPLAFAVDNAFKTKPEVKFGSQLQCFFQFLTWIYHLCVPRDFGLALLEKRPKWPASSLQMSLKSKIIMIKFDCHSL